MTNRRIFDYKQICEARLSDIEYRVRSAIERGWQPFGNPVQNDDGTWVMVIVMYEDE